MKCLKNATGTGSTFRTPVPDQRAKSTFSRVQTTTFALLYPVFVQFPAKIGYRRPLLPSCTRPTNKISLSTGTDNLFCLSVPGRRTKSAFARVQTTSFALLYPTSEQPPAKLKIDTLPQHYLKTGNEHKHKSDPPPSKRNLFTAAFQNVSILLILHELPASK